jgi:hypothetical protein
MVRKQHLFVLPLLLTFLGYCGDGKSEKSENWLSTSDLQNLVAPAGLSVACQSAGHLSVSWDASIDTIATHLRIERKSPTQDYEQVVDVAIEDGVYVDAVANNIIFTYRVQAIIKDGEDVQYVSDAYSATGTGQTSNLGCVIVVDPDEPSELEPINIPTPG